MCLSGLAGGGVGVLLLDTCSMGAAPQVFLTGLFPSVTPLEGFWGFWECRLPLAAAFTAGAMASVDGCGFGSSTAGVGPSFISFAPPGQCLCLVAALSSCTAFP